MGGLVAYGRAGDEAVEVDAGDGIDRVDGGQTGCPCLHGGLRRLGDVGDLVGQLGQDGDITGRRRPLGDASDQLRVLSYSGAHTALG